MHVPRQGVHAHRTLGLATFDVIATIVAAFAIAWARGGIARDRPLSSAAQVAAITLALVVLGALVHVAFGIRTALNVALGLAL